MARRRRARCCRDEGAAVHLGGNVLVHVAAPYALAIVWIASRTCWKVPQRQILVMASSISASSLRVLVQKRRHRHDHAALAIAALRNVLGDPGFLHLVQCGAGGEPFDRGDLLALGLGDRDPAGTGGDTVHVNGAGAALCDAAAIFCAGQPGILADRQSSGVSGSTSSVKVFR